QGWSTEDGLPQNSVHQIFQTRDGYIWVSTEGGVARFNSVGFRVFSQENTSAFTTDNICCFAQSADGSLWIGTADGLLRYSGGVFRHYAAADGSPLTDIRALAAGKDGGLYILTDSGIVRFDGKEFSEVGLPSGVVPTAMSYAEDGSLWIAAGARVYEYRNGGLRAEALPAGVPGE